MGRLSIVLVASFLFLQAVLWFGEHSLPDMWQLERTANSQQVTNKLLRERNMALDAEVRDLKQGKDAVEERARFELGMIGPGETFVQVIEE